jgi:uncharacterized FAD-dependent dehydrogenase
VLTEFVKAGAPAEILYVSKPHIGTFKLVTMVEKPCAPKSSRWAAKSASAARVEDIEIAAWPGARPAPGRRHADRRRPRGAGDRPQRARYLRACSTARGVHVEAKPFSIGLRIEHPQTLIDRARLGKNAGQPAARRGRLQAGASLRQWPLGLQLLHVSRAARWWPPLPSPAAWSPTA